MDPLLLELLDRKRDGIPRSTFISMALEKELNVREDKNGIIKKKEKK